MTVLSFNSPPIPFTLIEAMKRYGLNPEGIFWTILNQYTSYGDFYSLHDGFFNDQNDYRTDSNSLDWEPVRSLEADLKVREQLFDNYVAFCEKWLLTSGYLPYLKALETIEQIRVITDPLGTETNKVFVSDVYREPQWMN